MFLRTAALLLLTSPLSFSATILGVSDIMFVGYSSEGDTEDFSFVTFVELTANTEIRFSDRPWTGTAFDAGNAAADGEVVWNSGGTVLAAGSVVVISVTTTPSSSASSGTTTGNFGTTGLSTAGEIIFAYQGTSAAPSFVHALNYRGLYDTPSSADTLDSLLPTSLNVTNGNVMFSPSIDNGEFSVRDDQTSLDDYKALISDPSNWTLSDDDEIAISNTAFTTVPEPGTLVLSGVAGLLLMRRARAKRGMA